ncbi:MAG: PIN domain-containing protein [Alphaproteobacteria bacterium]|nr:MAG: PIN domain-containing protein [Alphaproteobacteria bacterium]
MPGSFFDSNVLLYSAAEDEKKAARAEALMEAGGVISVQVLNEITNVLRRKRTRNWTEVLAYLDLLRVTYDAMLIASALVAECDVFWSEDMHDGLVIDGTLTIRNPFSRVN